MHCLPARGLNAPKWPWSNRGWLDETLCVAHSMGSNKLQNALWERRSLHQNACAVMCFKVRLCKKNGREKRAELSSGKDVAQLPTTQPNSVQTFAFRRSLLRRKAVCRSLLSLLIVCIAPSYGSSICISNRNQQRCPPKAQSPPRRLVVHFWLPDVQLKDPQPRAGESMRSAYAPHGRKRDGSG